MGKKAKVKEWKQFKKSIKVHCSACHSWIDEDMVKFINIEEDIQGADILTFECPHCKTQQKSKRFG
jgi:hypothetical protein